MLSGDLGQLAALLFELGGGGGQIGFELALVLAQLSGVDARLLHRGFHGAVTADHLTLFVGQVTHGPFGPFQFTGHGFGGVGGGSQFFGHALGGLLGGGQFGPGSAYLLAEGAIAVNLAALLFQVANLGFGVGEVFGGDAALAGDGLEGGGKLVHRPEQDL